MEIFGVLGSIASLCAVFLGMTSQFIKNKRRQSTEGVSIITVGTVFSTYVCWSVYGWTKPDLYLACAQTPGVIITGAVLAQFLYYKK